MEPLRMADLAGTIYRIDKGVPIPTPRSAENPLYEAAKTMDVGDSVVIPKRRGPICGNLKRATGFKFTQRTISETEMRIWRIE
jgi:hypothetical protein